MSYKPFSRSRLTFLVRVNLAIYFPLVSVMKCICNVYIHTLTLVSLSAPTANAFQCPRPGVAVADTDEEDA